MRMRRAYLFSGWCRRPGCYFTDSALTAIQVDVLLPAVQRLEDALVQDTAEARAREEQPVPPEP